LFFNNHIFQLIILFQTGLFGALFAQQSYVDYNIVNSSILDNRVNCIEVDTNNVKWIGTEWGLVSYNDNSWVDYSADVDNVSIRCIEFDKQGKLWVGVLGGLYRYNGIYWTHFDTSNSNLDNQVNCIAFDSLNNPWIGTQNGLFRYDGRNFHLELDSSGLEPGFINVTSLAFQGDSLIIGTKNGGIAYLHNGSISWYTTFSGNLPDNTTFDINIMENSSRLFASPQGGLLMHHFSGSWFNWNIINTPSFPSNSLRCIEKLDSNSYLAGTIGAGIFSFSFQLGSPITTIYNISTNSLPDNDILDIAVDLNGVIWIGTEYSGLVKWDNTSSVTSTLGTDVKKTIGLYDLLGRKTEVEKNKILFNIKEDFSVDKVLIIE
jgi:ligand-binding sensor domain-containing protein